MGLSCDITTISYTDCILTIEDSAGNSTHEFFLSTLKISVNATDETLYLNDSVSELTINLSQLPSINGGVFITLSDLDTFIRTQRNLCQCGCGGGGGGNILSINTDTTPAQTLTVGTTGTDFAIVDDMAGDHKFNLPTASAVNRGALSSADWSNFNSKEPTITVLPISKGGTNSGTALANNRIIQSSGGAIVEATAITANRALVSDANGIPVHSAVTNTELGYVSGVTSAIQTQINAIPYAMLVGTPTDVIAASTTSYLLLVGSAADNATESVRRSYLSFGGTSKNLVITTVSAQPGTGSLIFTVRKNGADTSVTLTIAAGSAAGGFSDTVNSFTFVGVTDYLSLKCVNNATGTSANIGTTALGIYQ